MRGGEQLTSERARRKDDEYESHPTAHNDLGSILASDGGGCEEVLAEFAKAGVDVDALGAQLQDEGARSFVKSWNDLMAVVESKSNVLSQAA